MAQAASFGAGAVTAEWAQAAQLSKIVTSSLPLEVAPGVVLHVQRFRPEGGGLPMLLIHGLVEDGRIFYSRSGKGLAPWLATQGYDVFVPDLRAHGQSTPALQAGMQVTQRQLICEDLPALFELIEREYPGQPFFAATHSWGGVWLASALIRQPQYLPRVAGIVHFACKRVIYQRSLRKRVMIDLLWGRAAKLVSRFKGYVPARALGAGSADESCAVHRENLAWMSGGEWRDLEDGFDYALALDVLTWPPGLYLAGKHDRYLGHVEDVKAFARELGKHDAQIVLLEKGTGCSRDYGHNDMLAHTQAVDDHFPLVLSWLVQRSR